MKIRYILSLSILFALCFSCSDDDDATDHRGAGDELPGGRERDRVSVADGGHRDDRPPEGGWDRPELARVRRVLGAILVRLVALPFDDLHDRGEEDDGDGHEEAEQ